MQSKRDRREWTLLGVILLLGILLMCIAGQIAIRPSRAWQVPADMGSKIDPDSRYQYSQETLVIEPLDQDILTPVTWPGVYDTPTKPGDLPASTLAATATRPTRTSTGTATILPTATVTALPTATRTNTATRTATPIPTQPTSTNTPPAPMGRVNIIQNSVLDHPQNFVFTTGFGPPIVLDDDLDATQSNTSSQTVLVGSYTVTQLTVTGWTLTGIVCTDPDGGTTVNLGTRTATVDVDSGETVTCTFTDRDNTLGSVTIVENSILDDIQAFSFSTSAALGLGFSLDDAPWDAILPNSRVLIDVPVGSHTVTETVPGGWALTGLSCVDPDGGSSGNLGTRTATIDMDAAEDILCTFTNTDTSLGTITIIENSVPDGAQDFAFSGSIAALNFSLDDDADGTLPNSRTVTLLPPGTYNVTENDPTPAGWELTGLVCLDPNGNSTWDLGTRSVSIALNAGENVTCTYTNSRRGTIVIVETSILDDPQDFFFTSDLGNFFLDDDGGANSTFSNTITIGNVPLGSHAVTETVPAGWTLIGSSCSDGSDPSNIVVDVDETVTCTFTNHDNRLGTITIVEDSVPDAAQSFGFSGTLASFNLSDDGSGSNRITLNDVQPNTYTVTESVPGGWDLNALSCDDGSSVNLVTHTATIDLSNGENVICTFTNWRHGSITVVETSILDSSVTFDYTTSFAGGFSLRDDGLLPPTNIWTYTDVPTGTHTVQQVTDPPTWTLTSLICSDGSVDLGTRTATINFGPAESVTCTFTNHDDSLGTITIVEDNIPNNSQSFSFNGTAPIGSFSLADSNVTRIDVPMGTYSVSELDPGLPNWDLTGIACVESVSSSGSSVAGRTATIQLDFGEDITCTFTNAQRGTITIVQNSVPNENLIPGQVGASFSFAGSLGGFTLDDDNTANWPNSLTVSNLVNGVYTVTQGGVANWPLTSATCSDGSDPAWIDLAPGESVVCTFTNNYNYPQIGWGRDDVYATIPDGYSWSSELLIPVTKHGDGDWDLIYYERWADPPTNSYISMDLVEVRLSETGLPGTWITVFYFGGGAFSNTSIAGCTAPNEYDNVTIPSLCGILVNGTGIGIDIDSLPIPDVNYRYIWIYSPGPGGDGCDVDGIEVTP